VHAFTRISRCRTHAQIGPDDLHSNALAGLLVQLCKRDAFNALRTQQQLGYIVHMCARGALAARGVLVLLGVGRCCSLACHAGPCARECLCVSRGRS
jgi:hypothetical protein